jgi:hypothetical protein
VSLVEEPVCVLKEVSEGFEFLRKSEGSKLLEEMREDCIAYNEYCVLYVL